MPFKTKIVSNFTESFYERLAGRGIRQVFGPLGDRLLSAVKGEAPESSGRFKKHIKKRITGGGLRTALIIYHDPPDDPEAVAIEEGRKKGKMALAPLLIWVKKKGLGASAFSIKTRRQVAAGTRRIRNRKTGKRRTRAQSLAVIQRGIAFAIRNKIAQEGLPRKTGFPPSHRLFLFRDLKKRHAEEINASIGPLSKKITELLNG